jgi:hypothetical protein
MPGYKKAPGLRQNHMYRPFALALLIVAASRAAPTAGFDSTSLSKPLLNPEKAKPAPIEEKSMGMAYGLAVGGTVAPFALLGLMLSHGNPTISGFVPIWAGSVIGPSLGEFYAGSHARGWGATGVRTLGSTIVLVTFARGVGSALSCIDNTADYQCKGPGATGFWVGGAIYAAGTLYSLVDTKFAVERYRQRHARIEIGWTPTLVPQRKAGLVPGVMAWAAF